MVGLASRQANAYVALGFMHFMSDGLLRRMIADAAFDTREDAD